MTHPTVHHTCISFQFEVGKLYKFYCGAKDILQNQIQVNVIDQNGEFRHLEQNLDEMEFIYEPMIGDTNLVCEISQSEGLLLITPVHTQQADHLGEGDQPF